MKSIMICLLPGLFFACSNKKEVVLQTAERSAVTFSKDTVRVREKDWANVRNTGNGQLTVRLSDPGHALNMQIEDVPPQAHILYRGVEIKSGESIPVMDSVLLFCVADAPGLYAVAIWLTDRLGRVASKKLFIRCVAGQPPVATFLFRDLGSQQLQSWNYLFDASGVTKPDGVITEYHYSVNGQAIPTNQPLLYWTFHAKGDHQIGLFVVDDLGNKSDTYYQTLTIL